MKIKLPYGKTDIVVNFPSDITIDVVYPRWTDKTEGNTSVNEEDIINEGMDNSLGNSLNDIISTDDKVAIIVTDITRPVPVKKILDVLIKRLEKLGISKNNLLIIIARGLHRAHNSNELKKLLGSFYYKKIKIIDHNALDNESLIKLGNTRRGTPIIVNKAISKVDKIITIGYISPHPKAGFSGGGKSIAPGIAGEQAIYKIHRMKWMIDPRCTYNSTDKNPMFQDIREFASIVGVDYIINVIINDGKIVKAFAGNFLQAHDAGISLIRESTIINKDIEADIVVITPGGYPLDQNLYQATKGLAAAWSLPKPLVKKGGEVILVAKCNEGFGMAHEEGYRILMNADSPEKAIEMMIKNQDIHPVPGAWGTITWATLLSYAKVSIVSDGLNKKFIERMHMNLYTTIEEALNKSLENSNVNKILVIPNGPETIIMR